MADEPNEEDDLDELMRQNRESNEPLHPYVLTENDKDLLRRLRITAD